MPAAVVVTGPIVTQYVEHAVSTLTVAVTVASAYWPFEQRDGQAELA